MCPALFVSTSFALVLTGHDFKRLLTSTIQNPMKAPQVVGWAVAVAVSVWASFSFFRCAFGRRSSRKPPEKCL